MPVDMSFSQGYAVATLAAGLALLLLALQPLERRIGRRLLLVVAVLAAMLAAADALVTAGHGRMADALAGVAMLGLGIVVLRSLAVLLLRGLLPLAGMSTPRLVVDLTCALLYLLWAYVWLRMAGVDLTSVVTTSAIVTAVVAFSMQDTLGNVLGGVALQMDNSIAVGQWVRIDDVNGRVVDIRWRYTAIETRNGEIVIVPNSHLMKNRFVTIGSPLGGVMKVRRWVWVNVTLDTPPSRVCEVLRAALTEARIAHVLSEPEPSAVLMDFVDGAGRYGLRYWLDDPREDDVTDSLVRSHVVAALERNHIQIAIPQSLHTVVKDNETHRAALQAAEWRRRREAIGRVPIFVSLSDAERDALCAHLVHAPFASGDIMTRQGAVAHWLYILLTGRAEVTVAGPSGSRRVAVLEPGSVFGEMGLMTGDPRHATVTALEDAECYRLDKAGFESILQTRPDLSREISKVLAQRQWELQRVVDAVSAPMPSNHASDLLARIRCFFGLGEEEPKT